MSYESLLIGILVIVLLVIAAYHALASGAPSANVPERQLWRDEEGKLVAVGERQPTAPSTLSGRGAQTTNVLQLAAGAYRIDYQFDALTRLALIDDNNEETILIKSGAGSAGFEITEGGRYRLRVEPAAEGAAWQIAYRRIGT
jgi:hypothetical protein